MINTKMLQACEKAISQGHVDSTAEWARHIGIQKQNIRQIRLGTQTFRHEHILAACDLINISVDYIYGRTAKMVPFRSAKKPVRS